MAIIYLLACIGAVAIVALPFILSMISDMKSVIDCYEGGDDDSLLMFEESQEEFQNCLNDYAADVIENAVTEAKVRKGVTHDKLLEVANRHRSGELVIVMNTDSLFDGLQMPVEAEPEKVE